MKLFTSISTTLALTLSLTLGATAQDSLLPYTPVKEAKGDVKKVFTEITATWGMVPAPIAVHSLNPEVLKALWSQFKALHNKNFSEKLQAMMRMSVASSDKLDCEYCISFNEAMLLNMFKLDIKEINSIKKDPNTVKSLNEKEKKMLIFMVQSTREPKSINKAQIKELKKLSWSDKDIFDGLKMATQMVAMTLMVDTLKISRDF